MRDQLGLFGLCLHPLQFAVAMSMDHLAQGLWEQIILSKITLVASSRNLWLVMQKKKKFWKYTGISPVIKENRAGPGSFVMGVNRSFL